MQICNGWCTVLALAFLASTPAATVFGQAQPPASQPAPTSQPAPAGAPAVSASSNDASGVPLPPGFVIGADDVLIVKFWADTQISGDALVRSDGRITLPLLGDVFAIGQTPEQLSEVLEKAASKFITDPDATVIVKEIRSRKVFVLGPGIARSGVVPLNTDMNVLQLIATSGGLLEYADKENIVIIRTENGRERRIKFNYNDVVKGRNVQQNILLQPNDTVLIN
jgi:polysaccharide export outer membrane protein